MSDLRSQLNALAANFAEQVIAAIQTSSLQEIVGSQTASGSIGAGRAAARSSHLPTALPLSTRAPKASARLPRRSAEEIAKALDKVALLVKTRKAGMRAEEIRSALGMEAKEMPRILKEGISKKKLTTKGQKRATTYFAK
jgi:hypothetical protein